MIKEDIMKRRMRGQILPGYGKSLKSLKVHSP